MTVNPRRRPSTSHPLFYILFSSLHHQLRQQESIEKNSWREIKRDSQREKEKWVAIENLAQVKLFQQFFLGKFDNDQEQDSLQNKKIWIKKWLLELYFQSNIEVTLRICFYLNFFLEFLFVLGSPHRYFVGIQGCVVMMIL